MFISSIEVFDIIEFKKKNVNKPSVKANIYVERNYKLNNICSLMLCRLRFEFVISIRYEHFIQDIRYEKIKLSLVYDRNLYQSKLRIKLYI